MSGRRTSPSADLPRLWPARPAPEIVAAPSHQLKSHMVQLARLLGLVVAKVVEPEAASRHRIPVQLFASSNAYEALMLAFIQSLTLSSFAPVFALKV